MANFDEMAKAAKAKSENMVDAAAEAERLRQEANVKRLSDAEQFLRENVLPIVEQAADAFSANGIDAKFELSKSWRSSSRGVDPLEIRSISFQCETRLDSGTGAKVIRGDQYSLEHDGENFAWNRYLEFGTGVKFTGGTVEDFVSPVIGRALESCFEKLREAQKHP